MTHDEIRIAVLTMPIAELRERTAALCYFGVPLPDDDVDVVGAPLTPNDNKVELLPCALPDGVDAKLYGSEMARLNDMRAEAKDMARGGAQKTPIAKALRDKFGGAWSDARGMAAEAVATHSAAKSNGLDATA